jgi:short-subunit dehydrogenase
VVVADVGEWGQVQRLADEAINRYGRFDTWVNNAGVSVYGTVEQTPLDEIERVVQVDLMGQVYGIKAALPQLTRQRRGAIVCVGSGLSIRAVPLQAPYCAAKHGLRGFVEALRLELRRDHPGLHVALIMPASVNTPFFDHARSHLGVRPAPFPPVYDPASVAEAIVASAQRQVRDVYVGGASKLLATAQAVSPSLVDSGMMLRDLGFELQRSDRPDHGDSNLYEPSEAPNAAQGTWSGRSIGESLYTRTVELRPRRQRLLALGALAGAVLMARRTG